MKTVFSENPQRVGLDLKKHPVKRFTVLTIAFLVIIADYYLAYRGLYNDFPRKVLALSSFVIIFIISGFNLKSMGLSFSLHPGKVFWIKVSALALAFLSLAYIGCALYEYNFQKSVFSQTLPREFLFRQLRYFAVEIPLIEETLYRSVLCVCIRSFFGFKWTILISGVLFALLHFVYKNPALDNFLGGFFLSWSFLVSGSIFLPLLFHSIGNAISVFMSLIF